MGRAGFGWFRVIPSFSNNEELDDFLLAYRTTPHTVTGEVPADIFFGRSIRTKIPSFKEFGAKQHGMKEMEKRDHEKKQKIKRYADQKVKAVPSDIEVGDKVLLKREKYIHKLSSRWQNKIFMVVNRYGNSVVIQDSLGRRYKRNVSCIKKYFARSEVNPQIESDSESDVDYAPFSNSVAHDQGHVQNEMKTGVDPVRRSQRQRRLPERFQDYVMH